MNFYLLTTIPSDGMEEPPSEKKLTRTSRVRVKSGGIERPMSPSDIHCARLPNTIMDFTGKIVHIGQLEQFETRDGRKMYSREITLKSDDQYPRMGTFTLRNELAENFAYNIGDCISVRFDLDGFQSKDGTRYFNKLAAWRIN